MELILRDIAYYIALAIESVAILIITWGAIEAVMGMLRVGTRSDSTDDDRRAVWLAFARWLIAGLTFQLAADLINTSFSPSWDELGRLAVIAGIRTFLSFFLDREVEGIRERQHRPRDAAADER